MHRASGVISSLSGALFAPAVNLDGARQCSSYGVQKLCFCTLSHQLTWQAGVGHQWLHPITVWGSGGSWTGSSLSIVKPFFLLYRKFFSAFEWLSFRSLGFSLLKHEILFYQNQLPQTSPASLRFGVESCLALLHSLLKKRNELDYFCKASRGTWYVERRLLANEF